MGIAPSAGQVCEPFRPRWGGRNSVEATLDDRGHSQTFYFSPIQRPPLPSLNGEFWPAEGAIPIGRPDHQLEFSRSLSQQYLAGIEKSPKSFVSHIEHFGDGANK